MGSTLMAFAAGLAVFVGLVSLTGVGRYSEWLRQHPKVFLAHVAISGIIAFAVVQRVW